jgi:hypothetical protein
MQSRESTIKKYYEFLKALKAKLNSNQAIRITHFAKEWRLPTQIVPALKQLGWLTVRKNVQKKRVYTLHLEDIEPWHGERLLTQTREYMLQSRKIVSKKQSEEQAKSVRLKSTMLEHTPIGKASDEQLLSEIENRGYMGDLTKKFKVGKNFPQNT